MYACPWANGCFHIVEFLTDISIQALIWPWTSDLARSDIAGEAGTEIWSFLDIVGRYSIFWFYSVSQPDFQVVSFNWKIAIYAPCVHVKNSSLFVNARSWQSILYQLSQTIMNAFKNKGISWRGYNFIVFSLFVGFKDHSIYHHAHGLRLLRLTLDLLAI